MRRDAALLAMAQHEHVVPLRATVPTSSGLVLVFGYAEGGSLAALLAHRGALAAGEAVGIVAPLAMALGELHARGFVHGNISPANVLFDRSGKPLLADLGVAGLMGVAGQPIALAPGFADPAVADGASVAAADVHGLAAVCHAVLSGAAPYRDGALVSPRSVVTGAPPALVEAIDAAMSPDFRSRPDAAAFARALYAAATPRPVAPAAPVAAAAAAAQLEPTAAAAADAAEGVEEAEAAAPVSGAAADDDGDSRVARHARVSGGRASRLVARRLATPLLAAGLLAVAVLAGVAWAGRDRPAAASAQAADASVSSGSSWLRVLGALDAARDHAFAGGDPDELAGVYVAGSSALATDRQTLVAMKNSGQHAEDLSLTLVSVEVRSQTPTRVTLLVRDRLPPYEIVGSDGVSQRLPGRGERLWLVTLQAASGGSSWRIAAIDAA